MDTFKAIFKDDDTEGVYGISLVNDPAMEAMFIALSKEEPLQLKATDEEKRILTGAVLIPDKAVYRNQGGREFNVVFPADTIRLASQKFFQKGHQSSSTLEHQAELQLKDVTIVESWIKEDAVNDKSVMYGFDEPVGTWYASMKINNDSLWQDFVKTGKVKGFSIDGFFNMEQVNLNKDEQMDFKKLIKDALIEVGLAKSETPEEIKLGSVMTVGENPIQINFEGEMLGAGTQITMTGAEGEQLPVPDGEYTTEDGKVLTVAGSLVSDVQESAPAEEAPATLAEAPEVAPQVKSEKVTSEVIYMSKEQFGQLAVELSKMVDDKIASFKAEQSEVKDAEVVSLTKTKGEKAVPFYNPALQAYREAMKKMDT